MDGKKRKMTLSLGVLLGLASAVAAVVGLLALGLIPGASWLAAALTAPLIGVVALVVIARRGIAFAVAVTVVLVAAAAVVVWQVSAGQRATVERYRELWRANGWPVSVAELLSEPPPGDRCQAWLDALAPFADEGLEPYLVEIGVTTAEVANALASGDDVRQVVERAGALHGERWATISAANLDALTAAESCAGLRSAVADEPDASPWDAELPPLLGMMRWARSTSVQALELAVRGETEEGARLCLDLVDAARRLELEGQQTPTTLVEIAIERIAAVTLVAVEQAAGGAWPDAVRAAVESAAERDLGWAIGSVDVDRVAVLRDCEMMPGPGTPGWPLAGWTPMRRAYAARFCEQQLAAYTAVEEWLHSVPDLAAGDFEWPEARTALAIDEPSDAAMTHWLGFYQRLVLLRTSWRLAIAVDDILRFRATTGALPERAEQLASGWPVDPFSGEPLRYRTPGPATLVVYSAGPDEIDAGGESLYVSGPFDVEDARDIGYRIALR